VDPIAGLDDEDRKFLTLPGLELLPLGRPVSSQSLYRLSYPGSSERLSTILHRNRGYLLSWTKFLQRAPSMSMQPTQWSEAGHPCCTSCCHPPSVLRPLTSVRLSLRPLLSVPSRDPRQGSIEFPDVFVHRP
jgi:hypothetical protein